MLIGIIDTGFDLSHPMFRDRQKNLRVDALLEQLPNNKSKESSAALRTASMSMPMAAKASPSKATPMTAATMARTRP